MSPRLSPTTPLGAGQLMRYSTAPIATVLYVVHEAPEAVATYWLATARGSLLSPEGADRQIKRFEGSRSEGVLLTGAMRRQMALQEAAAVSPIDNLATAELSMEARAAAFRRYDRHMRRLAEIGLLHRCSRADAATLYLRPHGLGEPCVWTDCPIGVFTLPASYRKTPRVVAKDTPRLSERHPTSLGTGGDLDSSESAVRPAAMAERPKTPGVVHNKAATKAERGMSLSPAEEEEEGEEREIHAALPEIAELVERQLALQLKE